LDSIRQKRIRISNQRKQHLIRNMLSSIMITTVVVVSIIVFSPVVPTAEFLDVGAFGRDIFYQVRIVDNDETITPGSLKIVAENNLEYYEVPLEPGIASGAFELLKPNVEYTLSVRASRGFGEESLVKTTVRTTDNFGGKITETNIINNYFEYHEENRFLDYQIITSYNDLKEEIESVRLFYAFRDYYEVEEEEEVVIDDYQEFLISEFRQETILEGIPHRNGYVFLLLEATLKTSEIVTLHQLRFRTPTLLNGSIYVDDVQPTQFSVAVYPDYYTVSNVLYTLYLKKDGRILDKVVIDPPKEQSSSSEYFETTFKRLRQFSLYDLDLEASYTDPITGANVKTIIRSEKAHTTKPFTTSITITDTGDTIDIFVVIDDPNEVLHNIKYAIFMVDDTMEHEYDVLKFQQLISMNTNPDGTKTGSVSFARPSYIQFKIKVISEKHVTEDFIYYWCNLKEYSGTNAQQNPPAMP